jgi:hypothetical protein
MADPKLPPHEPPMLTRASITFHTNDDDKDDDTTVYAFVMLADKKTIVAKMSQCLGHFGNNSDSGPYNLVMVKSVSRDELKTGYLDLESGPNGDDTWRFNFLLDLYFSDGGHLFAKANGIELSSLNSQLFVGLE